MGDHLSYWKDGQIRKDSEPYNRELSNFIHSLKLPDYRLLDDILVHIVTLTRNARSNIEVLTGSYNFLRKALLSDQRFSHLFLLSADILLPPKTLQRLMFLGSDVAIPLIPHRGLTPTVYYVYDFRKNASPIFPYADPRMLETTPHAMLEVDGGSTACMLIHRRVLKAVGRFKNTAPTGVDPAIWFSMEITNRGFKIVLDTQLRVEHLDEDGRIY